MRLARLPHPSLAVLDDLLERIDELFDGLHLDLRQVAPELGIRVLRVLAHEAASYVPDRASRSGAERGRWLWWMAMLRAFIALDLDDAIRRGALALIDELRGERLPRVRWVAPTTMHVTVRFLGDTDEALVPALSELVTRVGGSLSGAIDVRSTSLLAFPNVKRARVLALHLDEGGISSEIAAATERDVRALGFAPETRAFRPHLTLGRLREPGDLRALFAARAAPMAGGRLASLTLYKSDLGAETAVHTPLARHSFGAA